MTRDQEYQNEQLNELELNVESLKERLAIELEVTQELNQTVRELRLEIVRLTNERNELSTKLAEVTDWIKTAPSFRSVKLGGVFRWY